MRLSKALLHGFAVAVLTSLAVACDSEEAPTQFTASLTPLQVDDVIPGQQIMLVTSIAPDATAEGVRVTARTIDAYAGTVAIEPPAGLVAPGKSTDVRVVPGDVASVPPGAATPPPGMTEPIGPDPRVVPIVVTFTRGDQVQEITAHIQVSSGEDTVAEYAAELRDRFVRWLATAHSEFGIDDATPWSGSVVKPHWLVVTHYLWFSEKWEMGLTWHVMIPPYDWARIYLRPRDGSLPTQAFEISSLTDAEALPHPIEIPTELDR